MTRRLLVVLACLLSAFAVPAQAQLKGVRFEVTAVGDTTLTFLAGTERWIRRGIEGIAVDPARRDVLVARLRVLRIDQTGEVTAMLTGQTTAVTPAHVVLIQEVQPAWYRRRAFWGGMLLGAALGATAGTQL